MRTLLDSVVVLIVLFGFTLFLLPFFSFETIKPIVDSFARDNSADMFTRQRFDAFGRLGGVVTLVFFLAATCIIFFKGRLASYFKDLLDSFRRLINDFLSYVLQVWQGTRRSEKAVVVGVFTAGVLLRAYFLADPIRNFDEAYTHYYFSSRGLIPLLTNYHAPNNHVFHSLLVRIFTGVFGDQEWAIRLPAFLAGVISLPLVYLFFHHQFDQKAAILSLALATVSPVLVHYSVTARGYSLATFFFISLLFLSAYLREHREASGWVLWIFFASLGLFTVPTMAFPLAVALVWWFLLPISKLKNYWRDIQLKSLVLSIMAAVLLTCLFYLPIIIFSGSEALLSNRFVRAGLSFSTSRVLTENAIRAWGLITQGLPLWLALLLAIFTIVSFLSRRTIWLGLSTILGCTLLLLIYPVIAPSRIWPFLALVFFGLSAVGLSRILRLASLNRRSMHIVLGIFIVLGLGTHIAVQKPFRPPVEIEDGARVAHYLKDQLQEDDGIIGGIPGIGPVAYYLHLAGISDERIFWPEIFPQRKRIWIVATAEGVRDNSDHYYGYYPILKAEFGPATIKKKFLRTTLYLLSRKLPDLRPSR